MTGQERSKRSRDPLSYQERKYRLLEQSGLVASHVSLLESDLHVAAPVSVEDLALRQLTLLRRQLDRYIEHCPRFLTSLVPLPGDETAPVIIQEMLASSRICGVGPMAAVAGAVAESVGRFLLRQGIGEVIVENGGDDFLARTQDCVVGIYAGESPLSNRIGIRLRARDMPCGVCCSSRAIGHSLSFGASDAVVAVASSTALADAAATRVGNEVGVDKQGINKALECAKTIDGLAGVVVIRGKELGAWGAVELLRL